MAKFCLVLVLAVSPSFVYGMTGWDFIKGLYNQTIGEKLIRDRVDRKKNKSPHWDKVQVNIPTWGSEFFWGLTDQGLQHMRKHGMSQERDFYLGSIVLSQKSGVAQFGIAGLFSKTSELLSVRSPDFFPKANVSADYSDLSPRAVGAVALATPSIMGVVWFHKDDVEHLHVHRNISKVWPVPDAWSDYLLATVVVGFSDGSFLVRLAGMQDNKPALGEPLMPKPLLDLPNWGRQEGETAALAIVSENKIIL